nr:MAG TPA: hypothetical protein [Caudoviricetes sp.]
MATWACRMPALYAASYQGVGPSNRRLSEALSLAARCCFSSAYAIAACSTLLGSSFQSSYS